MNRFSRSLPIAIACLVASAGLLVTGLSNVTQAGDQGENSAQRKSLSCHDLRKAEHRLRKFLRAEAEDSDANDARLPEVSLSCRDLGNFAHGLREIRDGQRIFRYDTFGDEAFWGDTLRLHEAIAGEANGGVGPGVSPATALAVGLKIDVAALPRRLQNDLRKGRVDLQDPATTLALLQLDAVVGVRGFFDDSGRRLESVGITCALCHSTVNDSLAPGIGRRLDGWAARDLNVGAIIALAPNVQPLVDLLQIVNPAIDGATVRDVLQTWGPGKFDAELLMDGKAFRPDGKSAAS